MKFRSMLAVGVFALASLASGQSPNIQGISLGIPLDKAVSLVGPGYQHWGTKSSTGRFTIAYEYKKEDSWVFQAVEDKVVYMYHTIVFTGPNFPEIEPTRQRLFAKYGQALDGTSWRWAWDLNERLLGRLDYLRGLKCQQAFEGQSINTPHGTIVVPRGANLQSDCSYILSAAFPSPGIGSPQVMGNISFTLMDIRPYRELALKDAPAAAAKKKEEDAKRPVVPF